MSNQIENSKSAGDVKPSSRKFRISRLVLKELRETLRDRRTIVTLILMPLLVYPALSLVFQSFLRSQVGLLGDGQPIQLRVVYSGSLPEAETNRQVGEYRNAMVQLQRMEREENASADPAEETDPPIESESNASTAFPEFADFEKHEWFYLPADAEDSIEQIVELGGADVGVRFGPGADSKKDANGDQGLLGSVELIHLDQGRSGLAALYLTELTEQLNQFDLRRRLRLVGMPTAPAVGVKQTVVGESDDAGSGRVPLASIVPLILVLMTITGAVYPAIDLTAGERERGTLETLMAAPIPRFGILLAKFVAVLTVAMMTAVLNIIGMFATVWVFQLDKQLGGGLFGFDVMIQMLLLLVLFAAFFSAVLLVVTSFAKSFKEAQVYLIPVILLSLGPGLLTLSPGMELAGINTICPMINILLLARDVINNEVQFLPAIVAILSTLVYSVLAIRVAASIFGSDAMLFADSSSLVDLLKPARRSRRLVPLAATLFCLLLLVPLNFASVGFLNRLPMENAFDLQFRFGLMGVFLFLMFLLLPTIVARHQNASIVTGFGLKSPRPVFWLAGLMLGISLWPIVMWLTTVWSEVYGSLSGADAAGDWHKRLVELASKYVEMFKQVSPAMIAIVFAIVPALCEEWFFRGMLLRTLLGRGKSVALAIVLSAVLFGAFHTISNSVIAIDRLIPTTLVGLILGYLAYKSDSIWPGVILHAIHNSFVVFLATYQEQLAKYSWFPAEQESVPVSWVLTGAAIAGAALTMVILAKRDADAVGAE